MTGCERIRMIRRAAVAGTIQPVHSVAGLHEVMHPAGPPAETHHVCSLRASAVNHNDGIERCS
jgi:hypothetical protein